jgi:hypothetical protein
MKVPDLLAVRSGHRMLAAALAILAAGSACWAENGPGNAAVNRTALVAWLGTAGTVPTNLMGSTRPAPRSPLTALRAAGVGAVVTPPAWAVAGNPEVQYKATPSGVIYFIPGR